MKIRHTHEAEPIQLQMVPMIDIVFQLLIFFLFTLKIVAQEGDFNVRMPLAAPSQNVPDTDALPPMKLRLVADASGNLETMQLNERAFGKDFQQLRAYIMSLVGGDAPSTARLSAEIELDCDYQLRYENVIAAVTAVTGYMTPDGQVVKLIEKIKFAPPRKAS